jgi:excinuclease ABC subunit B
MRMVLSEFQPGRRFRENGFLHALVQSLYSRGEDLSRGTFRVKGDVVEIALPYVDLRFPHYFFLAMRLKRWKALKPSNGRTLGKMTAVGIFSGQLICNCQG